MEKTYIQSILQGNTHARSIPTEIKDGNTATGPPQEVLKHHRGNCQSQQAGHLTHIEFLVDSHIPACNAQETLHFKLYHNVSPP